MDFGKFRIIRQLSVLGLTGLILVSCTTQKSGANDLNTEEYAVINDFYKRAHLPLYHKAASWLPGEDLFEYDSILNRPGFPEAVPDSVLKGLINPASLSEIRQKTDTLQELYFRDSLLNHLALSRKSKRSIVISRPVVVDSLAVIRQFGETNTPIFILKKGTDGHWGLRYTFFQETPSD